MNDRLLNRIWGQLLLLGALAAALSLVQLLYQSQRFGEAYDGWSAAVLAAAAHLPWWLSNLLPAVAGAAAAVVPPGALRVRTAAFAVLVVTAAMLVLDYGVSPLVLDRTEEAQRHGFLVLLEIGWLLLPALTVGIVVGLRAWIRSRMMFARVADERIMTTLSGWLLIYMLYTELEGWVSRTIMPAYQGEPAWTLLLPWAPLTVIAVLGWRAAGRAERTAPAPSSADTVRPA